MTHRRAIVFDSSGTLMRMYRVAKDTRTGKELHNISSLRLVRESQALVAIDIPPDTLLGCPPDQSIQHFLVENGIAINIGCASESITADEVRQVMLDNCSGDVCVCVSDLMDVVLAVKKKCKNVFYSGAGFIIDVPTGMIPYVICTAGKLFSGAEEAVAQLTKCADLYIASGDSMRNLSTLARHLGIPQENVVPVATPVVKERLIRNLKNTHEYVVMVGDEINDLRAITAADVGVLTVQQRRDKSRKLRESADMIIDDLSELPHIIRELKL